MKKGDILGRKRLYNTGDIIFSGFTEPIQGHQFITTEFTKHFPNTVQPLYEIVPVDGKLGIKLLSSFEAVEQYKVNWVIDGEVALQNIDDKNSYIIVKVDNKAFYMLQESSPSFQSQVAHMTDEQLRASIDALRNNRASLIQQPKKTVIKVNAPKEQSPMEKLLASLGPEDKAKLMAKLGMA